MILDYPCSVPELADTTWNGRLEDFALLEASYAIVRIIQTFPRIDLPEDEPRSDVGKEKQTLTLVIASAEGCRVRLER